MGASDNTWPLPAYYYALSFDGISGDKDAGFQEASGLNAEIETEDVLSGGQNQFRYKLPKAVKYTNLVLKRGMMSPNSALTKWCSDTLTKGFAEQITTKGIVLKLLNEKDKPVISWKFANAYPVKWSVSDFKSQENSIVIETLEFAYNSFEKV